MLTCLTSITMRTTLDARRRNALRLLRPTSYNKNDDENAHCARCGRELDSCGIRRAAPGGGALYRLRDRCRRPAVRGAAGLCVLSRLWRAAAGVQLLLVPPAGL